MRNLFGSSLVRSMAVAIVAVAVPTVAPAAEILQCSHDGNADVTVSLGAKEAFGQTLGCIEGPFVGSMTACAPKNAYGLSASSGGHELIGVTPDWRRNAQQPGPISGVKVSKQAYLFEGGQLGPDHKVKKLWTFEISRSTGHAVEMSGGGAKVQYQCAKAKPKL